METADHSTVDSAGAVGTETASRKPVVQVSSRLLTPDEEAILEHGRQMVVDAAKQVTEFHKIMLGLTATFTTLMATSFTVLVLGQTSAKIETSQRFGLIVPVTLMLGSALAFLFGFAPVYAEINLQTLETIRVASSIVVTRRRRLASVGILLFSTSILSLLWVITRF